MFRYWCLCCALRWSVTTAAPLPPRLRCCASSSVNSTAAVRLLTEYIAEVPSLTCSACDTRYRRPTAHAVTKLSQEPLMPSIDNSRAFSRGKGGPKSFRLCPALQLTRADETHQSKYTQGWYMDYFDAVGECVTSARFLSWSQSLGRVVCPPRD